MVNVCSLDNARHAAKGTGYFLGASGCSLALLGVAAAIMALAVGLLAWDGLFVYSVGVRAPMHLIWAIPISLGFVAVDLLIILNIGRHGGRAGQYFIRQTKEYGEKMVGEFKAIQLPSST